LDHFLKTKKVEDERAELVLPAELPYFEALAAQEAPMGALDVRDVAAQFSRSRKVVYSLVAASVVGHLALTPG
jgi:hypothetical protein